MSKSNYFDTDFPLNTQRDLARLGKIEDHQNERDLVARMTPEEKLRWRINRKIDHKFYKRLFPKKRMPKRLYIDKLEPESVEPSRYLTEEEWDFILNTPHC
jgi:hypothetical protein